MYPEEFIGRCLDAASRVFETNEMRCKLESLRCAHMILGVISEKLEFCYMDNEFCVEFIKKDEMLLCSALMKNSAVYYHATLVLSLQTNKAITHWTEFEDVSPNHEELVLLRVATTNFLNIGQYICR